MELRELLSGEAETVAATATVADAAIQMQSALRVIADGADPELETVGSWMTTYPDSVDPGTNIAEAGDWMLTAGYRHLPVVENEVLVGMASIKDILWALTQDPRA